MNAGFRAGFSSHSLYSGGSTPALAIHDVQSIPSAFAPVAARFERVPEHRMERGEAGVALYLQSHICDQTPAWNLANSKLLSLVRSGVNLLEPIDEACELALPWG